MYNKKNRTKSEEIFYPHCNSPAQIAEEKGIFQYSSLSKITKLAIFPACVGLGLFCMGCGSANKEEEMGNIAETETINSTEKKSIATEPSEVIINTKSPVKKTKPVSLKKINATVKRKYEDLIDKIDYNYDLCKYAYYDIDEDGIKDLIIGYGSCEADYMNDVYTANTKCSVSYAGGFELPCQLYEAEEEKCIYSIYEHMGYGIANKITLNNGRLKAKELWNREISNDDYASNLYEIPTTQVSNYYYDNDQSSYEYEDDYILPYSSYCYLDDSDVDWMSSDLLRLARNEIYARHGRIFNSADLNEYFNSQSWYIGLYTAEEFNDNWLNKYERANVALIQSYE